jgi:hypothetical protein
VFDEETPFTQPDFEVKERSMHRWRYLVLATTTLLCADPVFAEGQDWNAKEGAASQACLSGDATRGVAVLGELFAKSGDATYIFNQGRCYELGKRYPEAVERFREYLRLEKHRSDAGTAAAQKHLADCQAHRTAGQPVPRAPRQPADLRTLGLVVVGIGGLSLATGVVLNLKANSVASSITPPNTFDRNTEDRRQKYAMASWFGYGFGALALASGTFLYFASGRPRLGPQAGVALAPVLSPGQAGALLKGEF